MYSKKLNQQRSISWSSLKNATLNKTTTDTENQSIQQNYDRRSSGLSNKSPFKKGEKLKIKDIINIPHETLLQEMKSPFVDDEIKMQLRKVIQDKKLFTQLGDTLKNRKVTFARFGFKSEEQWDDIRLKPILKGLQEKIKPGSMLVTELWTPAQQKQYMTAQQLNGSKRTLKRYAHWDWDHKYKNCKYNLEKEKEVMESIIYEKNPQLIKIVPSIEDHLQLRRRIGSKPLEQTTEISQDFVKQNPQISKTFQHRDRKQKGCHEAYNNLT